MKEVIASEKYHNNAEGLTQAIRNLILAVPALVHMSEVLIVKTDGEGVAKLIEETLTDGSKVYNLEI